jgi:signal transduction histidine kinase/PAS domain-containing protein
LESAVSAIVYPFLQGGGEMGALTREFDWSKTSLGPPDLWPQSLRTTVSNLLRSKFPMFLWWGGEMIQFYNDAYRPSMGNDGKHPSALGAKGKDTWPEIWDIISPLHRQVETTGEATWMEDQLVPIYRNGKLEDVYWTYSYSSVLDDEGNHGGILVTCTETTEKVKNIQALKEGEEKYRSLFQSMNQGFCMFEMIFNEAGKPVDYRFLEINHVFETQTGLKGAEGKTAKELVPNLEDHWFEIYGQVALTGDPIIFVQGSNAMGRWFEVYAYRNGPPKERKVALLFTDITERKNFAEELQKKVRQRTAELEAARTSLLEANKYLQSIINKFDSALASLVPIFEGDTIVDFYYKMTNVAYKTYSNLLPEEILNKRVGEVFPGYFQTDAFGKYAETFNTGKSNNWELHYNKDDLDLHLQVRVDKMEDEVVVNFSDFTVLKNLQLDLQHKVKELERSNDELQQFAHVASHDLKEPTRKIRTYGNRLKSEFENDLPEKAKLYLEKIERATMRMYAMIDGVLLYSSLNAMKQAAEKVDLNVTMQQILEDLEVLVHQKDATVNYTALPVIEGSPVLLYQLFYNLVNNSLKFTRAGTRPLIQITCELVPQSSSGNNTDGYALIEVADNGIGFAQEYADNIFETFVRLNSKDQFEGTGLGLSLCQKIAGRHGGSISAKGKEKEGAVFSVLLPLKQA